MGYVDFKKIYKKYDNAKDYSVKDFNLEIQKEEFVVFVGPSGCGKSTTLRMLAGLEEITDGEILIEGSVVNDVHPKDRDIAMVFQNYALYPHMSVYDNIAFGLKIKKVPKEEIKKKVEHAANILGLEQYLKRKPKDLSGGQRQRVALGRAIVRNPKVFLMDEPLSNLDAKLRVSMRNEITKLHKELKATTVYVTHDQVEAMTMADKIVVLKDGIIQQIGTPMELYNTPINTFVAGFIGTPNMNLLNAKIKGSNLILENQKEIKISEGIEKKLANYDEVIVGIRAEDFSIKRIILENNKDSIIKEKIVSLERMGNENNVFVKISSAPVVLKIQAKEMLEVGQELEFVIKLENAHFFDSKTNLRIN